MLGGGKFALNFAFDLASRCASTLTALLYFCASVQLVYPSTHRFCSDGDGDDGGGGDDDGDDDDDGDGDGDDDERWWW